MVVKREGTFASKISVFTVSSTEWYYFLYSNWTQEIFSQSATRWVEVPCTLLFKAIPKDVLRYRTMFRQTDIDSNSYSSKK